MLKRKITYINFDGKEVTEDFYFNLNKAELTKILAHTKADDLETYIKQLSENEDFDAISDLFEDIIKTSYGRKTEDGLFIKRKDEQEAFLSTDAYGNLFIDLISNEGEAQAFAEKVIPQKGVSAPASVKKTTTKKKK